MIKSCKNKTFNINKIKEYKVNNMYIKFVVIFLLILLSSFYSITKYSKNKIFDEIK
jgi:hypothetical protein